jgi:hypothetical protein
VLTYLATQVNAAFSKPHSLQTAFTCNLLPWLRLPPSSVGVLFFPLFCLFPNPKHIFQRLLGVFWAYFKILGRIFMLSGGHK